MAIRTRHSTRTPLPRMARSRAPLHRVGGPRRAPRGGVRWIEALGVDRDQARKIERSKQIVTDKLPKVSDWEVTRKPLSPVSSGTNHGAPR